jgi:hypothetical protein
MTTFPGPRASARCLARCMLGAQVLGAWRLLTCRSSGVIAVSLLQCAWFCLAQIGTLHRIEILMCLGMKVMQTLGSLHKPHNLFWL